MILSLDCSTTAIGWAVFDNDNLIECGRLTPTEKDLEWRDRVHNLLPQLEQLIIKYKPTKIYQEDVPMGGAGGALVLIELAYVQGLLSSIEIKYCDIEYIAVGTWRKNIGINSGQDQRRNAKKIKSIEKANELFNLDLPLEFTSTGNYKENGSDDIADSILLYCSTRDKYKVKGKSFGKEVK
jgi:hypothetical protein